LRSHRRFFISEQRALLNYRYEIRDRSRRRVVSPGPGGRRPHVTVCRTDSLRVAERVADLLNEHGLEGAAS
jgi:hypothetical protein